MDLSSLPKEFYINFGGIVILAMIIYKLLDVGSEILSSQIKRHGDDPEKAAEIVARVLTLCTKLEQIDFATQTTRIKDMWEWHKVDNAGLVRVLSSINDIMIEQSRVLGMQTTLLEKILDRVDNTRAEVREIGRDIQSIDKNKQALP